jgi:hypothetical protein
VQGRFIVDALISIWEAGEWAKVSQQKSLFLRIEFDKAYDKVDWSFITKIILFLGFNFKCFF